MDEKILSLLQDLGLTRSEARVYIALVARGVSAATDVVRDAQVPHTRVYDIMSVLLTKGLVEIQTGKRRKYKAVDPEVAFERLKNRFREKEELATQYLSQIYSKKMDIPSIWMLKGKNNVIDKIIEILYKAKNEVLLTIPVDLLENFTKHLRKVARNGVVISLIIYLNGEKNQINTELSRYADIKLIETPSSILTQADFNECLLCSHNVLTSQLLVSEEHAIIAGDFEFLQVLSYYFYHSFWSHAEPILQEPPMRKYPRSFVHMWKAIEEVNMLLDKGYRIKANIKGRNVNDNNPTEFEALIKETRNINSKIFSIIVEKPDGTEIVIGGRGAFVEDVESTNITLNPFK